MAGETPQPGAQPAGEQRPRRRPSITGEQRHQSSSLSFELFRQQQEQQYLAMRRASASNFDSKQPAGELASNSLSGGCQQQAISRMAPLGSSSNVSKTAAMVSNRLASLSFEPSGEESATRLKSGPTTSRASPTKSGSNATTAATAATAAAVATTTTTTTMTNKSARDGSKQFARDEIDVVFNRLMALEPFRKLHPSIIRNLCSYAFIERIEKGVLVFRQGDDAINWYALLEGSVDVRVNQAQCATTTAQRAPPPLPPTTTATTTTTTTTTTSRPSGSDLAEDGVTLCTLGVGTTFGASVMPGKSHSVSVVTNDECTLLRVRRADFQQIFNEQSHLIHDLGASPFCPFSSLAKSSFAQPAGGAPHSNLARLGRQNSLLGDGANVQRTGGGGGGGHYNQQAKQAGNSSRAPEQAGERRASSAVDFRHRPSSPTGGDLNLAAAAAIRHAGGVGGRQDQLHRHQQQLAQQHQQQQQQQSQQQQQQQQQVSSAVGDEPERALPDACFRLILSKRPHERTPEEVDIVYEELQHLKALSHLTNSVKKQLAARIHSEFHSRQNTVIFNQGEVGHSWYIILRGSVNVVIVGKGVVCTLHDGDDFGKLALVNDAPRAATIVTSEPNCYFLRVDKQDFNMILRDVEANTVRLKEHGKEVLILQKVALKELPSAAAVQSATSTTAANSTSSSTSELASASGQLGGSSQANSSANAMNNHSMSSSLGGGGGQAPETSATNQFSGQSSVSAASALASSSCALKYMVTAGTGEKMLEHLLETRIDGQTHTAPLPLSKEALFQHDRVAKYIQFHGDNFLEDFILTHKIFMPTGNLCQELLKQYQSSSQPARSTATVSASAAPNQLNGLVDDEFLVAKKRRVIKFVRFWMLINREHFFQQQQIYTFISTLHQKVKMDAQRFASLRAELEAISRIYELQLEEALESRHRGCQRWIEDVYGNILPIRRHLGPWQAPPTATSGGQQQQPQQQQQQQQQQQKQQAGEIQMAASEQFLASLHQRRFHHKLSTIQAEDELVFRVYCADHTFTTLKCRFDEQAGQIKQVAARNLKLSDKELILVHVKSNGERIIYNDQETNICTCLSVNGRLFVCPLEHIDAVCPLPEQDPFQEIYTSLSGGSTPCRPQQWPAENGGGAFANGSSQTGSSQHQPAASLNPLATNTQANTPTQLQLQQDAINSHLLARTPTNHADIKLQMSLSVGRFEQFSSRDIAFCLTQLNWSLLSNMHEFELVYTVFGRNNFKQITANLNVFLRHFNEIQFWVVTQICLASSLSKRAQILRKFIKIAAHCKELQNLNAFCAIIMGLSNMAVARLSQTWERVPNKLKRLFQQFESLIDPSRNHRRYRLYLATLEPPVVPFMPLFLKDMTFAHEGNKTYLENGLINFEKMQMIAQALRTIRHCKARAMKLDPSICKFKSSIRTIDLFFRDLKIIDNQRTLTQMSNQLEHRKT